jgi:putative ABC transport system permease protein
MFRNYLKIALRNLVKNKVFSFINVIGLALGISACLVIYLLASYELSFEDFRKDKDRIYRISSSFLNRDKERNYNQGIGAPMPALIREELTGIEKLVAFHVMWVKVTVPQIKQDPKKFPEPIWQKTKPDVIITEPTYFDFFEHEWLLGSPAISLKNPNEVVLTESKMKLYFGNITPEMAVGKSILYGDSLWAKVSGVVKDQPRNTDFRLNDFISFASARKGSSLYRDLGLHEITNTNSSSQAFVKLVKGTSLAGFNKQLDKFLLRHLDQKQDWSVGRKLEMMPLKSIHFDTNYHGEYGRVVNLSTLYIMMGIAIFLLVMAAINFINLNTAQSLNRIKEIGVRKVLGGYRSSLIQQFLAETLVLTTIATLLAVLLVEPLLWLFDSYIPKEFAFSIFEPHVLAFFVVITLVTALLSGFYPAWVISAHNPVESLKNQIVRSGHSRNSLLRQGLIVFQFGVAQVFVLGTILVATQSRFMLQKDMGFTKDRIVFFNLNWRMDHSKAQLVAEKLRQLPEVQIVSTGSVAARGGYSTTLLKFNNGKKEVSFDPHQKSVDANFVPLFGLKMLAGRNLMRSDTAKEFVVNESFVKALGYQKPEEALGKMLNYYTSKGNPIKFPIVGVMADYHFQSLHNQIRPLFIKSEPQYASNISMRLKPSMQAKDVKALEAKVQKIYQSVYPQNEEPVELKYFDESIAQLYDNEKRMSKLLDTATAIAIFISCLGLFGLTAYSVQRRTKEIGIRKVLGASVANITTLLSKDFLKLVLLASVVASPVAYYFMQKWLQDFAYRIEISWWIFVLAGVAATLIALLTVSYQSIKAALANPVESLRTE